jgi:hypothetical protein
MHSLCKHTARRHSHLDTVSKYYYFGYRHHMAKTNRSSRESYISNELSSLNFMIFLTLAFMLIVAVVTALRNMNASNVMRTKAAEQCPATVTTCDNGKAVCFRGADGCSRCVCSDK